MYDTARSSPWLHKYHNLYGCKFMCVQTKSVCFYLFLFRQGTHGVCASMGFVFRDFNRIIMYKSICTILNYSFIFTLFVYLCHLHSSLWHNGWWKNIRFSIYLLWARVCVCTLNWAPTKMMEKITPWAMRESTEKIGLIFVLCVGCFWFSVIEA